MTEWLPCVVSDDNWRVNGHVNEGDHIYRIFNDKIDIKGIMTIKSLGWSKISLHLTDIDADILDIKVDEKLRVCQTSSENDPGTLVVKREMHFNEALKSSCLYRVIDSELNFQYLMYIRNFTGGHIDADIMKLMLHPEMTVYSMINAEHALLSVIDLRDMMFTQIPLGEGCNFKFK